MVDFLEALDQKADDQEKPKDPPQGTYIWVVSKEPSITRTGNGEWDVVEFPIKAVAAEEDVDADSLEEYGPVDGIRSRISFLSPTAEDQDNDRKRTLDQINKFMERTLLLDDFDTMTTREAMSASVNHQFMGQLVWEPRKDDPEIIQVRVKNWAPMD
jgi:hypothetical protein